MQSALSLVLFTSLFLSGSSLASSQLKGKIVLTGSSTIAPLAIEIGKKFEKKHPKVRVDVQTGGSSRGIADTRFGVADIGMVSRELKKNEIDLKHFTVALDGISIILNNKNSINNLTNKQIVSIYSGQIKNWKELGGDDAPITVVHKASGRSTLELFLKHFKLKNREVRPHIIIGDNEQGIKTVSGNPHAIGYVSIGAAEFSIKDGVNLKLPKLDGSDVSISQVQKGLFSLSRPLNFVTKKEPIGVVKKFIEFAKSNKVHNIIKEQYFVPTKH